VQKRGQVRCVKTPHGAPARRRLWQCAHCLVTLGAAILEHGPRSAPANPPNTDTMSNDGGSESEETRTGDNDLHVGERLLHTLLCSRVYC
jgi:hypothetical protein